MGLPHGPSPTAAGLPGQQVRGAKLVHDRRAGLEKAQGFNSREDNNADPADYARHVPKSAQQKPASGK